MYAEADENDAAEAELIVLEILLKNDGSSPIAAASSFSVSRSSGAELIRPPISEFM